MSDTERNQGQGSRKAGAVQEYHTERKRTDVRQHRSKLAVHGKDENFEYRWVLDTKDSGGRIRQRMNDDWVLVRSDEIDDVGEDSVFKSEFAGGSIIRTPAGSEGNFYYLMKIRKDWFQEDQQKKVAELAEKENSMFVQNSDDGNTDDTYDAIAGVKGANKPSRIIGVSTGGKPT